MNVDPNDPRPAYVQLADGLREAIRSGQLAAGDRLPTGKDLATSSGVAVMTARQALNVLRAEGLIRTVHGRGAFVMTPSDGPSADPTTLRALIDELTKRVDALEAELTKQRRGKK